MKRTVALLNVLLVVLLICTFLQQADAVSSAGKATVKWGEVKAKALEKGAKPSDSGELVMSEDEFAMAIWKYLSENQRDGAKSAFTPQVQRDGCFLLPQIEAELSKRPLKDHALT